jgi:predicted amidohydrolase
MNLRIALAQIDPVLGDTEKNVALHIRMAEKAVLKGAALIVFPELSLTGYSVKDMNLGLAVRPANPPDVLTPLLEISKRVAILAGGIEEDISFRIHNAAFLFEGGTMRSVHRKVYPPTYGMFEELRYFSPGTRVEVVRSPLGILGVLICEDLWHLPLPYLLAQQGAQVIIAMVASPTRLTGSGGALGVAEANSENHRAYARLLSCYLAFCNRTGFEDGLNFWGASGVIGPDGAVVAQARQFEEDLIVADITDNEIRRARQASRHFLDDDPRLVLREIARLTGERY